LSQDFLKIGPQHWSSQVMLHQQQYVLMLKLPFTVSHKSNDDTFQPISSFLHEETMSTVHNTQQSSRQPATAACSTAVCERYGHTCSNAAWHLSQTGMSGCNF